MTNRWAALAVGSLINVVFPALGIAASAADSDNGHGVFVMTNDATKNEIIAYRRTASTASAAGIRC